MVDVRINSKGIEDLIDSLPKAVRTKQAQDKVVNRILYNVQKEAKKNTPVDTGQLRRSIYTYRGGLARGYVSTNTDYAVYVHEGLGSNARYGRRSFMEMGLDLTMDSFELEIDKFLKDIIK